MEKVFAVNQTDHAGTKGSGKKKDLRAQGNGDPQPYSTNKGRCKNMDNGKRKAT